MELKDIKELQRKVYNAKKIYNNATEEDKIGLAFYIDSAYRNIANVREIDINIKNKKIFNSRKEQTLFFDKILELENNLIENFIKYQDFHLDYFESTIQSSIELDKMYDEERKYNKLTEKEFHKIFIEFLESLGLSNLYERYLKDNKIHDVKINEEEYSGATLYNPLTKDMDIFINNFSYDIRTMFILAHEFGHVYDLERFDGNSCDYEKYMYESLYGETISKLFERLFLHYLINNNIYKEDAQKKLIELELINIDYMKSSLMLCLIDEDYLEDDYYKQDNRKEIVENCLYDFYDEIPIFEYLVGIRNLDIKNDLTYSYGNILSLTLNNIFENNNKKLLDEFMSIRTSKFNPKFINKHKITPERYNKEYKKELELLKK